ncbi:MAG TPA: hypothetical protein VM328_09455 [Fimbriimonadaceae bacterium]|jgi:hypothetical protein|nr:hypothetical protein [Fimbriimonadaceae bacterium]HVM35042.1 hypothetical protein [Actinomycetota bacterium]
MTYASPARVALAVCAVAISSIGVVVATSGEARADRCQPTEIVTGSGTAPIDERDDPVCAVMDQYVYPFVCPSPAKQPLLPNCIQNVDPNPNYRPPLVPQYNPDLGRIYCNLYKFIVPGGTCTTSEPQP